jgi:G3E family GTPase
MTRASPLPVTFLTGFLGAGKTTLLNRLLRGTHGVRLSVLVNDFGAINIDAGLVEVLERDVISLTNGCACCTMRGGLVTSVLQVLDGPNPPEHLVVEASGIADPVAMAGAFRLPLLRERARIHAIITLVDAENARNPRLDAQLIQDQIQAADIVVLNKIDLVDVVTRRERREWIRSLVPQARIVEVVNAEVPLDLVLGGEEVGNRRVASGFIGDGELGGTSRRRSTRPTSQGSRGVGSEGDRPGDGGEGGDGGQGHVVYESWSYETECRLAYRAVRDALEMLPSSIFRAKGVLQLADMPNVRFVAQMVGRRVSIEPEGLWGDEWPRTEIVCIGEPGALTTDELARRLNACVTGAVVLMSHENLQLAKRRCQRSAVGAL